MKYILFLGFLFNNADMLSKSSKITEKKEVSTLKRSVFEKTGYFFKKTGVFFGLSSFIACCYFEVVDCQNDTVRSALIFALAFFAGMYLISLLIEYIRGKDFKGPNE